MSLEKMNSKIEAFVPNADPNKIQEVWEKLIANRKGVGTADLWTLSVQYGAIVGYKCFHYMVEAIYHGYTPNWVDPNFQLAQEQDNSTAQTSKLEWWQR